MSALDPVEALTEAVKLLGSQTAVAEALGLKQQSVNDVIRGGRPAPPKWCIPLERATGGKITRHELRPDLYPQDQESAA